MSFGPLALLHADSNLGVEQAFRPAVRKEKAWAVAPAVYLGG
jgi:hypothetical protein